MRARSRKAFSLVELLTVIGIIMLLISILLPALGRAREVARRTVCLANIRSIAQGCITYSVDNSGHFPSWSVGPDSLTAPTPSYTLAKQAANMPDPGFAQIGAGWNWNGLIGGTYDPGSKKRYSNSRNLWMLVRNATADAKNFICPSDGDANEPFQPAAIRDVYDVQNRSQLSYVFQYQGTVFDPADTSKIAWGWNTTVRDDPKMVILADSTPMMKALDPSATGATGHTFELASSTASTFFPVGNQIVDTLAKFANINYDPTNAKFSYNITNGGTVALLNSPSHRGEGQNVVRLDCSGDFAATPWAGMHMDNIYTVQDPAEYIANPIAGNQNLSNALKCRLLGLYDVAADVEGLKWLTQKWIFKPDSQTSYPDSFLVP